MASFMRRRPCTATAVGSARGTTTVAAGGLTLNAQPVADAFAQLEAYFAGELTSFDLTLAPQGTPFQLSVWRALRQIPYGQTRSYGALARAIGRPKASRAVGAANGSNPLPKVERPGTWSSFAAVGPGPPVIERVKLRRMSLVSAEITMGITATTSEQAWIW